MPIFTKSQKEKLVTTLKAYKSALKKRDLAQSDLNEKLNQLKTASQASGEGQVIIDDTMRILGQFYLDDMDEA